MDGAACPEIAEVDGRLVARCPAPGSRARLDVGGLRAIVEATGFRDWAIRDDALAALLLRWTSEEGVFEAVIGERQDARATVDVAGDAMQAWIDVVPARGGRALCVDDLVRALAAAGVCHGEDRAALEAACASRLPTRVVAASGTPPQPGEDTRFEVLVADTRDRRPQVDEQGRVDFHELGAIPIVRPGQCLMRRHPPTAGLAGRNVRGETLPAPSGRDEPFDDKLVGSCVSADDRDLLSASITGQPVRTERAVMVEPVLRLEGVSLETGNIRFDGTVEIQGDVQPGMAVEASGDIVVAGLVEGARLAAGGCIRIAGGLIAKSIACVGQSFAARFVEHSEVRAGTTIAIEDAAVHSDLQALSEVLVGVKSRQRGRLVGGSTRAMMRVVVPTLGAPAGGVTRVQVGVNPELDARAGELRALVVQRQAEEDKLGKLVRHLQAHGDPRGVLERARASWRLALHDLGEALREQSDIEQRLRLTAAARVEVLSGVDGEVDLMFGVAGRRLRHRYTAGRFETDAAGRIVFTPHSGQATTVE